MMTFEFFNNTRDAYRMEFMETSKKDREKGENPYKLMRRELGLPD